MCNESKISRLEQRIKKLEDQVELLHDKLRREQFETQYTGQEVYYGP
jgi:hypothetical protein